MWKIAVGFIAFAGLALFILSKGGDIDMSGEKHGIDTAHEEPTAASAAGTPEGKAWTVRRTNAPLMPGAAGTSKSPESETTTGVASNEAVFRLAIRDCRSSSSRQRWSTLSWS